jgi:hypothetical protein
MAINSTGGGWTVAPVGLSSQSTMQQQLSPAQVQQIQATTGAMAQPGQPAQPGQQNMMNGLFGAQSNLGQNMGSAGGALWGSTPAYGGGNILSGDAYGGSAQNPLPGLTAADYGQ